MVFDCVANSFQGNSKLSLLALNSISRRAWGHQLQHGVSSETDSEQSEEAPGRNLSVSVGEVSFTFLCSSMCVLFLDICPSPFKWALVPLVRVTSTAWFSVGIHEA